MNATVDLPHVSAAPPPTSPAAPAPTPPRPAPAPPAEPDVDIPDADPLLLRVGGDEFRLYPLNAGTDLDAAQEWVDLQAPNPAASVAPLLPLLADVEQQKFAMREAIARAARPLPRLGSVEADSLLDTYSGVREMLYLSIRKGRPGFTREQAAALYERIPIAKMVAINYAMVGVSARTAGTAGADAADAADGA